MHPSARGSGVGTLLSRGRMMFLHLARPQVPGTVASHIKGKYDQDGCAPFWECFGERFAPQWATSKDAEQALLMDPSYLSSLSDRQMEMTAIALSSLGAVNTASLGAFKMLMAEGLRPNGMYDPIDGGPTIRTELAATTSSIGRTHGRLFVGARGSQLGEDPIDALVSNARIDGFRAVRGRVGIGPDSQVDIDPDMATGLEAGFDELLGVFELKRS